VVEKAMLPTRFYYEKFSDQVRLWVNEDSTPQPEVREHFEAEARRLQRAAQATTASLKELLDKKNAAIGEYHLQTQAQITRIAVGQHVDAACIGGEVAAEIDIHHVMYALIGCEFSHACNHVFNAVIDS
jgi:hypothetical protein